MCTTLLPITAVASNRSDSLLCGVGRGGLRGGGWLGMVWYVCGPRVEKKEKKNTRDPAIYCIHIYTFL